VQTTIAGSEALLNLSLLAITFATVTALVMLVRQTMGGKLSNFDVYLIVSYVSLGFIIAIDATLPSIFVLFDLPPNILWPIVSILAAVLLGARLGDVIRRRLKVSSEPMSLAVKLTFTTHGVSLILLLANAAVLRIQGTGLYLGALTLSLAVIMWAFVRRVASLLGDKPMEDWDPKRG
jgi:hypothetical protein